MKKTSILLALIMSLTMSGCKGGTESGSSGTEASAQFISAEDLKTIDIAETARKISSAEYDNLKFAESFTVNIGTSESLGIYEAERRTDLTSQAEDIFKAYFGDGFDSSAVKKQDITTVLGADTDISYSRDGLDMHVNSTYIYLVNTSEAGKHLEYTNSDDLRALCEVTDDFKDERIALADGTAAVGELSDKMSGFFAKLKDAGVGEFKPFTVASLTNESQGRSLPTTLLTYRKHFKGLPIFNMNQSKAYAQNPLSYVLIEWDQVTFASPESVSSLSLSSPYKESKEVERLDSILSPKSAVDIASNTLAEYINVTALRLDLVYVPIVPEGADNNLKVTFSPYWQLSFGLKPLDEHYALINAKTGEISYVCSGSKS